MGGTRGGGAFGASKKANNMVLKGSTKGDRKKRELVGGTFEEMGKRIFDGKKRLTRTGAATGRATKMGQAAGKANSSRRMSARQKAGGTAADFNVSSKMGNVGPVPRASEAAKPKAKGGKPRKGKGAKGAKGKGAGQGGKKKRK